MYELIAAPFLNEFLLLRPGYRRGVRLSAARFADLATADPREVVPDWLARTAATGWQVRLAGRPLGQAVLVRRPPAAVDAAYARASWEITLGCNWACEHCYLGDTSAGGLDRAGKTRLVETIRDAGVLWLQITGGEPALDADFAHSYALAWDLGMMVTVSTNASTLARPGLLELFARRCPYRIAVSLYGADEPTYRAVTGRKGGWAAARRGVSAARSWGVDHHVYPNLMPTIDGGDRPIHAQSVGNLRARPPFSGCAAGRTFFHVNPHGQASVCKVDRDTTVDLVGEGTPALQRLAGAADVSMLRTGWCQKCPVVGACGTCPPLARRYQAARAPRTHYCRHPGGDEETTP